MKESTGTKKYMPLVGAAGIGSGGSPNANASRGNNGRGDAATVPYTKIEISGGDITSKGGEKGGAGIGLGGCLRQ